MVSSKTICVRAIVLKLNQTNLEHFQRSKSDLLESIVYIYKNKYEKYFTNLQLFKDACLLKLFANDTNLLLYSDNMCELEGRANNYLKEMELWFLVNKLSLNIDKTCYMIIPSSK